MKTKNLRLQKVLYSLSHIVLLLCICLTGFGQKVGVTEVTFTHIVLIVVVLSLFGILQYETGKERLMTFIFLAVFLSMVILFAGYLQVQNFVDNYLLWAGNKVGFKEEWKTGYTFVQTVWVTVACYLLQMIMERLRVMEYVSAFALFSTLLIAMIQKISVSHICVVFVISYLVLTYVEATERYWQKDKKQDGRPYVLGVMPFCIIYLILMYLMPAPKKPYQWEWVHTAYQAVSETLLTAMQGIGRSGDEDFGLAVSGFSEDGNLFGKLMDGNKILLTIEKDNSLVSNVYLIGKVYESFDGREWTQTEMDAEELSNSAQESEEKWGRFLDTFETENAVKSYDSENWADYMRNTELTIRYRNFHTGYLFAPLKTKKIEDVDYASLSDTFLLDKRRGYGTEYTVSYMQLNQNHEEFWQMLEEVEAVSGVREDYIDKKYLQKPVLSEEMTEYLNRITEGEETQIGKLRAIENALSKLTYTKEPGKLPESVTDTSEFLDYFLLESKQGYCSYFATAFVLLARAQGIPARYVEGFCVPVSSKKEVEVYSGMAHAWPEVYIDGFGWLPFEPTPSYGEIRYTSWKTAEERKAVNAEYGKAPETHSENMQLEEMQEEQTETDKSDKPDNTVLRMIGNAALLVIIIGILLIVIHIFLMKYRYSRMNHEERFLTDVKRNLWLLKKLGYRRGEAETLQELGERTAGTLSELADGNCWLRFLELYEAYLYGRKEITRVCVEETRKEQRLLLLCLKQKMKNHFIKRQV